MSESRAHIAIVGAGNLGSRHLQGLTKINQAIDITVIEPYPYAMDLAKKRYDEMPVNPLVRSISCVSSLKGISQDLDLATNVLQRTFPSGLTTEIVSIRALEQITDSDTTPPDHEHVTHYIYQHPSQFRIFNLRSKDPSMSSINLAVDTEADLVQANWIANQLEKPAAARFDEIVGLARRWEQEAVSV